MIVQHGQYCKWMEKATCYVPPLASAAFNFYIKSFLCFLMQSTDTCYITFNLSTNNIFSPLWQLVLSQRVLVSVSHRLPVCPMGQTHWKPVSASGTHSLYTGHGLSLQLAGASRQLSPETIYYCTWVSLRYFLRVKKRFKWKKGINRNIQSNFLQ